MKTEHRLAEALKSLMATTPLSDITVTTLTKKCHIGRQSFYYHFHDIYDLLTLVFLDEKIPGIESVNNIKNLIKIIYEYYTDNKAFIDATIDSSGKDLFQEFIFNQIYKTFMRFIKDIPESNRLTSSDMKNIARFYSLGYSYSLVYYLENYKNKTLNGLYNSICFESDQSLVNAVRNLIKKRGQPQW